MADGKQKKVTQALSIDVYLTTPGGKPRKSYAGEIKRLQRMGFREVSRKTGSREDHLRIVMEREIDRYPGVPLPPVPPYIH